MIAEFADPRLAAVYDTINAYGPGEQLDFYRELAVEIGAASIVDLGCGTGLITRVLAGLGFRMTGLDAAPAMVEVARQRPFGDQVDWIVGPVDRLGTPNADLAIMSGHVAQFFVTDADWSAALHGLRRALRSAGTLAFESRNPDARGWEQWTRNFAVTVEDPVAGRIETWSEVSDVRDGIVTYTNHYRFAATGDELVSSARLRFRSQLELTESLAAAGFTVERVYGDWDRGPVTSTAPELIVVATGT